MDEPGAPVGVAEGIDQEELGVLPLGDDVDDLAAPAVSAPATYRFTCLPGVRTTSCLPRRMYVVRMRGFRSMSTSST